MIKRLLTFSLSICMIVSISAQQKSAQTGNTISPDISFGKTIHDFGELKQNAPALCEFTFHNKGNAPLIVSNVTASCGCTVPAWPKKPIMPGDSGIIQVKYSTASAGAIDKQVSVFTNATQMPLNLKLKGKVIR